MQRTYKVRELVHIVRSLGCRILRTRGSHQTWATPRGAHRFTLVINHPGRDASAIVTTTVRRALRAEGFDLDALEMGGAA